MKLMKMGIAKAFQKGVYKAIKTPLKSITAAVQMVIELVIAKAIKPV